MKTTAAILVAIGQPLELIGLDIPALRAGQVLIKVSHSSVCHTQLLEARGHRGEDNYLPHCLGHVRERYERIECHRSAILPYVVFVFLGLAPVSTPGHVATIAFGVAERRHWFDREVELLDWTARQKVRGKRGATFTDAPPIVQRLSMSAETWCELVHNFGRLFLQRRRSAAADRRDAQSPNLSAAGRRIAASIPVPKPTPSSPPAPNLS